MEIVILGGLYFLRILNLLIFVRVLMSWLVRGHQHPIARFVFEVTEPVLEPIRNLLPKGNGAMSMIDWSPLIALILCDLLQGWWIRIWM